MWQNTLICAMLVPRQFGCTNGMAERYDSPQESGETVEKAREKDCYRIHTTEKKE